MMRPDLPRITIPRERTELLPERTTDYSLKRPSRHLRQLPNGVNAELGQTCPRNRAHSPHQLDGQVVEEVQFGLGIDKYQSVRLGHLRGNFCEVLGASNTDRDWEAKLCAHSTTYCSR